MVSQELVNKCGNFIITYLAEIRFKASVIPQKDRSYFPKYWMHFYKISIINSEKDGLGINLDRLLKRGPDKISYKRTPHKIEQSVFNNLNYSLPTMFNIGGKNISIGHLTMRTDMSPFLILQPGADVRIYDVRFEQETRNDAYPMEKELLWIFSDPTDTTFLDEHAKSASLTDFWGYFEHLVFTKPTTDLNSVLSKETISLIIQSLQEFLRSYLNLITRADLDEQMLQNYIEQHYLLLSPDKRPRLNKRKIGPYIPDFILDYEDGSSTIVEIQLNRDKLFVDDSPSKGLEEALDQVKQWFDWIGNNDPSRLKNTEGMILIGRRESYILNKEKIDKVIRDLDCPVKFLTYDDLVPSIQQIMRNLVMKTGS